VAKLELEIEHFPPDLKSTKRLFGRADAKEVEPLIAAMIPGLSIEKTEGLLKPESQLSKYFGFLQISIYPLQQMVEASFNTRNPAIHGLTDNNTFSFQLYKNDPSKDALGMFALPGNTGHGVAKVMLQNLVDLMDDLERTKLTIKAGDELGGYVWLRYGGLIDPSVQDKAKFPDLKKRLKEKIDLLAPQIIKMYPENGLEIIDAILKLITSEDPQTFWAIANIDIPVTPLEKSSAMPKSYTPSIFLLNEEGKVPLGLVMFAGESWKGIIDLSRGSPSRAMLECMIHDHKLKIFPKNVLTELQERLLWER